PSTATGPPVRWSWSLRRSTPGSYPWLKNKSYLLRGGLCMEKDVMELVAKFMALSARTAPKAAGKDFIETKVITGEQLQALADECVAFGQQTGKKNWDRDGENVRQSDAVLLVSLKGAQT